MSTNEYPTSFIDREERVWKVQLTVGMVEYIKECTNYDLDLFFKNPDKLSEIIMLDTGALVKILWVICEQQAGVYGLSPRDFAFLFDRSTLDHAGNALVGAIIDFYPRSSAGQVIRKNLPRLLQEMDKRIEEKTTKEVDRVLSNERMKSVE